MQEIATRFFAELERHRRRRMSELLRNAVRAEDSLRIAELELAVHFKWRVEKYKPRVSAHRTRVVKQKRALGDINSEVMYMR